MNNIFSIHFTIFIFRLFQSAIGQGGCPNNSLVSAYVAEGYRGGSLYMVSNHSAQSDNPFVFPISVVSRYLPTGKEKV